MCHAVEDVLADKILKQSLNILVWYLNTVQITDTSVYQIILATRFPSVPVYYLPLQRKFFKESKLQQSLAFSVFFFRNIFRLRNCYHTVQVMTVLLYSIIGVVAIVSRTLVSLA